MMFLLIEGMDSADPQLFELFSIGTIGVSPRVIALFPPLLLAQRINSLKPRHRLAEFELNRI
jgi:hypothetical protein